MRYEIDNELPINYTLCYKFCNFLKENQVPRN